VDNYPDRGGNAPAVDAIARARTGVAGLSASDIHTADATQVQQNQQGSPQYFMALHLDSHTSATKNSKAWWYIRPDFALCLTKMGCLSATISPLLLNKGIRFHDGASPKLTVCFATANQLRRLFQIIRTPDSVITQN